MAKFDPDKFEDKYVHYFTELQNAYKRAFDAMNDKYDSELIHAIDQQVLNESEPFYEGDGEFRVQLPPNPKERVRGVLVDEEKLTSTLEDYVDRLETEIREEFEFE